MSTSIIKIGPHQPYEIVARISSRGNAGAD